MGLYFGDIANRKAQVTELPVTMDYTKSRTRQVLVWADPVNRQYCELTHQDAVT
jgi:hypothetical protein